MRLGGGVSENVTYDPLCGAHLPHLSMTKLPPESPARCSVLGLCLERTASLILGFILILIVWNLVKDQKIMEGHSLISLTEEGT